MQSTDVILKFNIESEKSKQIISDIINILIKSDLNFATIELILEECLLNVKRFKPS
jgi:hypothetical protein